MKLLIADDNPNFRKMLKSFCENFFDEILECADGDEAIGVFRKENPDWTLMDIKMKRLDGISATKEIKKAFPSARVIIVSQFKDTAFISEAVDAGAVDYVNKEDLAKIEDIIKNFENNY